MSKGEVKEQDPLNIDNGRDLYAWLLQFYPRKYGLGIKHLLKILSKVDWDTGCSCGWMHFYKENGEYFVELKTPKLIIDESYLRVIQMKMNQKG